MVKALVERLIDMVERGESLSDSQQIIYEAYKDAEKEYEENHDES